jgi:hypothetical protein
VKNVSPGGDRPCRLVQRKTQAYIRDFKDLEMTMKDRALFRHPF